MAGNKSAFNRFTILKIFNWNPSCPDIYCPRQVSNKALRHYFLFEFSKILAVSNLSYLVTIGNLSVFVMNPIAGAPSTYRILAGYIQITTGYRQEMVFRFYEVPGKMSSSARQLCSERFPDLTNPVFICSRGICQGRISTLI